MCKIAADICETLPLDPPHWGLRIHHPNRQFQDPPWQQRQQDILCIVCELNKYISSSLQTVKAIDRSRLKAAQ